MAGRTRVHQIDFYLSALGLLFLINYTQKPKNEQDTAEQATHALLFPTWTFLCVTAQKNLYISYSTKLWLVVLWVFWNKELPSTSQDAHLFVISRVEVGDVAGHFRKCHIPSDWASFWLSQGLHETDSHCAHCSDVKGHTIQGPQLPQGQLEHTFSGRLQNHCPHMQCAVGITVHHCFLRLITSLQAILKQNTEIRLHTERANHLFYEKLGWKLSMVFFSMFLIYKYC